MIFWSSADRMRTKEKLVRSTAGFIIKSTQWLWQRCQGWNPDGRNHDIISYWGNISLQYKYYNSLFILAWEIFDMFLLPQLIFWLMLLGGGKHYKKFRPPQNILVWPIWWCFPQKTIPLRSNFGSLLAKSNFPLFVFFWLFGNILDIVQNHDLGPKICKIELWSKKQSWRA